MKIAGVTDIHDSLGNLGKLIDSLNSRYDIEAVINCGDLLGRVVIEKLKELNKKQYVVLSEPDQKDLGLMEVCVAADITSFTEYGEVNLGGKRIGFTHSDSYAKMMKGFDVVFYGHLHDFRVEDINDCLFICCGEIMGRRIRPCYVIYDTETGYVEKVEL